MISLPINNVGVDEKAHRQRLWPTEKTWDPRMLAECHAHRHHALGAVLLL